MQFSYHVSGSFVVADGGKFYVNKEKKPTYDNMKMFPKRGKKPHCFKSSLQSVQK